MPFSFSNDAIESKLPAVGTHVATIADAEVKGSDTLWLNVSFQLESGHTMEQMYVIEAPENSPYVARLGEGFTFVKAVAAAVGVDVNTLTEADAIKTAFIGKKLQLTIIRKTVKGAPAAAIRAITAMPATA